METHWIWPSPDGITDINEADLASSDSRIASIAEVWRTREQELRDADSLKEFNARLHREFAIETNVIERVFRLDRGVTEALVEAGIKASLIPHGAADKPAGYIVDILQDALDALEWMVTRFVTNAQPVTPGSIKELHALLTRSQHTVSALGTDGRSIEVELLSGDWKIMDNQVRKGDAVLRYCPPERVRDQIEKLAALHQKHITEGLAPEVSAAWLHHRFTQIHPFQDGNGRVARCLASLVFIKAGLFPVVVGRDEMVAYIDALEDADAGNLKPLSSFLVAGQLRRFDRALNLASAEAQPAATVSGALQSIRETLRLRKETDNQQRLRVLETAGALASQAENRLAAIEIELRDVGLSADVVRSIPNTSFWYRGRAIDFAKRHGYFADVQTYCAWVRLTIYTQPTCQLLLHFHSRGREFVGVLVAAALLEIIEVADDGAASREQIEVALAPYEFYHTETRDDAAKRFESWLDEVLTIVLGEVQRML